MHIHNSMHLYEIPVIIFSGAMVALGWIAYMLSREVDCHDTGCGHPPCTPQKTKNSRVLIIATLLFAVNIIIFFGVHRNVMHLDMFRPHVGHDTHESEHLHENH